MGRYPKRSNYVKNKPSDLPTYLDDGPDESPIHFPVSQELEEQKPGLLDEVEEEQPMPRYPRRARSKPFYLQEQKPGLLDEEEAFGPKEPNDELEEPDPQALLQQFHALGAPEAPEAAEAYPAKAARIRIETEEQAANRRLVQAARFRARYNEMTPEERVVHNKRRRIKQLGLDPDTATPEEIRAARMGSAEFYAKKAEKARIRYHNKTEEQKAEMSKRRSESNRRRRQRENAVLFTAPNEDDQVTMAQKVITTCARRAECARLRYQKMSEEERKEHNKQKYEAYRKRKEERTQTKIIPRNNEFRRTPNPELLALLRGQMANKEQNPQDLGLGLEQKPTLLDFDAAFNHDLLEEKPQDLGFDADMIPVPQILDFDAAFNHDSFDDDFHQEGTSGTAIPVDEMDEEVPYPEELDEEVPYPEDLDDDDDYFLYE